MDPEFADIADKRIATYQAYFPATEVMFFYNITEGDSYTVECWINEVTTARAAK